MSNWLKSFKINGLSGLAGKPHTGRKSYLSQANYELLSNDIETLQLNLNGGRIRGKDIIEHLKDNYNSCYADWYYTIFTLQKRIENKVSLIFF